MLGLRGTFLQKALRYVRGLNGGTDSTRSKDLEKKKSFAEHDGLTVGTVRGVDSIPWGGGGGATVIILNMLEYVSIKSSFYLTTTIKCPWA